LAIGLCAQFDHSDSGLSLELRTETRDAVDASHVVRSGTKQDAEVSYEVYALEERSGLEFVVADVTEQRRVKS
jgi:hypothetical protein